MDLVQVSDRFTELEDNLQDLPLCFYCDEGGNNLFFCDGPCSRHFHWNKDDLELPLSCPSLKLIWREVNELPHWECKQCSRMATHCFVCGKEGQMDCNGDPNNVVEMGPDELCVKFYHRDCVEKELKENRLLGDDVFLPTQFTCPRHFCHVCRLPEDGPRDLIHCLRCTNAWHKDCFKDPCNNWWTQKKSFPGIFTQKMHKKDGIVLKWEFIYCYRHPIVASLGTPTHIHYRMD